MRALVGLVVLGLVGASSAADARNGKAGSTARDTRAGKGGKARPRAAKHETSKANQRAARLHAIREHERFSPRESVRGQSVGAPWDGRLQRGSVLEPGEGYFIRRPERAFGTQTTVDLTERAIAETLDAFPDQHVLAIGDISAPSGGTITQHHSHQSGRDIDVGLFYLEQPPGYPASFVHADADNLDCAATFKLLERFLATADEDGGVQMVFLDFEVQGILYDWAIDQGISERRLERIFQYPHGRGASEGIVRHEPNHDNHMHFRFRCPSDDSACR